VLGEYDFVSLNTLNVYGHVIPGMDDQGAAAFDAMIAQ
jgi:hypothetical protein